MQRLVDNVLAVTKESVKTFTYESLNNIVRFINGISAIVLAFLPGKTSILEGVHGWELRPTFRGPRLPQWMENGASSFNRFIHELSVDSDTSSLDYSSGEEDSDEYPPSPYSRSSRLSRANSGRFDRRWTPLIRCITFWLMFPVRFLFGIPLYFYHMVCYRQPRVPSNIESSSSFPSSLSKRTHNLKDHFVQRTTDRRHGVIEDLQLAMEVSIEAIFDIVHKAAHCVLSPFETLQKLVGWFFGYHNGNEEAMTPEEEVTVRSTTLGEDESIPRERITTFPQSLNTDARTCEDVITELGYPYEAIRVVTADGYVLLLERIPRRDARKVVYLQHGIMDSSMGWVANGIVGSPAFAAFDQGYDVFLGNLRGLVSREHVDKNISSRQYWRYSINEHGTEDIPAMVDKIHQIKVSELESTDPDGTGEETSSEQPYKLCVVCHSLGGAAILMYVITRRIEEKPHRLSRMILLSPAGYHDDSTFMFTAVEYLFLALAPVVAPILPGLYIPTRFFRMLLNKLARDFHNYPAVGGLVQTLMSYLTGGDSSNWVGVLGLPHYNMNDMPGVSILVALHLAQMKHKGKFIMFDYGSEAANMEVYGSPEPLDLGEFYGFIDIPVDLVAGKKDKVIRPSMVRKHYKLMRDSGVDVSYNEFEYAHLDFTFSHHEELLAYVMSRLKLVEPTPKQQQQLDGVKPMKLKKKEPLYVNGD